MRLYIEPVLSYNEFEKELQVLEFSSILEDDEGRVIRETNLVFEPVFGIDTTVLNWLNREERLVGKSNYKEILENEIKEINELIDKDTVVISWNDIFNELPNIESNKRIIAYHVTEEKTILNNCYRLVTGDPLDSSKAVDRIRALKLVYEHYRGKVSDTPISLTEEQTELKQTISEDIDE